MEFEDSFFKEEVRSGYTVSTKMKKVWAVELEILERFISVCEKHDLKYYVSSGTLLGTIRHKGFIPWDDDIDIVMFRDDYNKLLKVAPYEFEHPYFFQCAYTDKDYFRGHAQIRNSNTAAMLPCEATCVMFNQGIFLDIFPLDGIASEPALLDKQLKKMRRIMKYLNIVYGSRIPSNKLKALLKNIIFKCAKRYPLPKIFRRYERCSAIYSCETEYVGTISFGIDSNFHYLKSEWFESFIKMPFENLMVSVPVGYDEILKECYGEYLTEIRMPSEHGDMILDTEVSYKEKTRLLSQGE